MAMTGGEAWGRGVVLCVTGLSKQERQAVENLITHAGGSYTPNLSKRCTHLLVAGSRSSVSDKLSSALRNQHKWGVKLVSTAWLFACAEEGRLQPEAAYPAFLDERTPLAARPANQVGTAGQATASSRGTAIPESCWPQRMLRQDVSRRPAQLPPSRSLQGPSSLHTQPPEVKHSVAPAQQQQQDPGVESVVRQHSSAAGGHSKAVSWAPLPAVALPSDEGEEGSWGLEHLPLTQAGFMPTDDLLEQLQLGCAQGEAFSPLRGGPTTTCGRGSSSPEEQRHPLAVDKPQRGAATSGQGQLPGAGPAGRAAAAVELESRPAMQQRQGNGVLVEPSLKGQPAASSSGLCFGSSTAPQLPAMQQEEGGRSGQARPASPATSSDMGDLLARLQQVSRSSTFTPLSQHSSRSRQPHQGGLRAAAGTVQQPARAALPRGELHTSADLAQQLQALHAQHAQQPHAAASLLAGVGAAAALVSERAASAGGMLLRAGTADGVGQQAATLGRAHGQSALEVERPQPSTGAQVQLGGGAQQGAPSTAALLQQLRTSDTPVGKQQQGRAPTQHAQHDQPDDHWQGLGPGGSPMQISPAPLPRPAAAAAASRPLLHAAPKQRAPAELSSPMQVSPAPARDTASLLQQLQAADEGQQRQRQELRPIPSPLGTADLMGMLADPQQQHQQKPQPPSIHTAALLQQLQQSAATGAEGTGLRPPAAYNTSALLLAAVAGQSRSLPAPLDTAGMLAGLAGGNPTPPVPQPQPSPQGFHASGAYLLQQLQEQQPTAAQQGAAYQTRPAMDVAALLMQLQQQQSAGAEQGAARLVPAVDAAALLQQLQQSHPAATAEQGTARQAPAIDEAAPLQQHSAGAQQGGAHQSPSLLQQLQEQQQLVMVEQGMSRQVPAIDAATLLQQLQQQQSAGVEQNAARQMPGIDAATLLQQLQEPQPAATAAGAALGMNPVHDTHALLQQLQERQATSKAQPRHPATAPDDTHKLQAAVLQQQQPSLPVPFDTAGLLRRLAEAGPSGAPPSPHNPAPNAAALLQQQQQQHTVAAQPEAGESAPAKCDIPAILLELQAAAEQGVRAARRGATSTAPAVQPAVPAEMACIPSLPRGTPASDSLSVGETVMDTCSPSAAGSRGGSVQCGQQQQQQSQPQGRPPTPTQLQWPAPSQATQLSPSLRTLVLAEEPGLPAPTEVAACEAQGCRQQQEMEEERECAATTPAPPAAATQVLAGHGSCCGLESAAGSVNPARDRGSQVADSGQGVFQGLLAILDPDLPEGEADRVTRALQQGGGRVMTGARLGQGATHVVCEPEAALKWLSMGLGIVSPQWVLRSLKAGRQQRCLTLSADATRHLPQGMAPGQSSKWEESLAAGSSAGSVDEGQLQSKEAREQMLLQLAAGPSSDGQGCPASTPASLLVGVTWSVTDPPPAAALDRPQRQAPALPRQFGPLDVIPDSEDEEEDEQFCFQPTQAAYQEVLCALDSDAMGERGGSEGSPALSPALATGNGGCQQQQQQQQGRWRGEQAWLGEAVLRGVPSITLVLPRDGRGELGHDTRCFALPGRCASAEQLLELVHAYYQEAIFPEEQVELLRCHPSAQAVTSLVRPAFLDLKPLSRHQLLGARLSLEGLQKVTREPAGSIYELRLAC